MTTLNAIRTIPEQIAAQLRGELLAGRFQVGQPLREVHLAERFGVSRGPVRQVLQQLAQEGLLVARRNCGMTVAPPPPDSVRELLRPMRAMIETYALGLCFDELNEEDFRAWDNLLGRLRLACAERDYAAMRDCDFDLHRLILLRAGQEDLVPIWTMITARLRPICEARDREYDDPVAVHAIHAELLKVFRGGDKDAALKALSQHIQDGEFNENFRRRWLAGKRGRK
jgi:DNA-binding GntR family transcriptional regulator